MMMTPNCEADVMACVADAVAQDRKLAIAGAGSKAAFGAPVESDGLSLAALSGVVAYDPAELVLTVRPGTLLKDIQALVASERQMLAFDPFDHGPIYGAPVGAATIGGVIAAGAAGSRRLSAGGARDHLLGLRAVSGRAELFVAGGKVVKNVTGFDLPKLAAGSWGRLFAMTELTLKVLPRPETSATLAITGLEGERAISAMAAAMGSQAEVAAAAHRPGAGNAPSLTALRLEGFEPSVAARVQLLSHLLAGHGAVDCLSAEAADSFWSDMRTLAPLGADRALWRINIPPSAGAKLTAGLAAQGADWMLDWAGGLAWVAFDGDPALVRAHAEGAGGHATLLRASPQARRAVPAFHPPAPGLGALEQRVRRAFDPLGIFETGRF
ncbi:FAD-binding protein [Sphingobium aromaticivastans]|uniref:FAD-binding protein n=1 Tax=Sphingobium aromaticivastans TaxID=1778665 RepID=UPI00301A3E68